MCLMVDLLNSHSMLLSSLLPTCYVLFLVMKSPMKFPYEIPFQPHWILIELREFPSSPIKNSQEITIESHDFSHLNQDKTIIIKNRIWFFHHFPSESSSNPRKNHESHHQISIGSVSSGYCARVCSSVMRCWPDQLRLKRRHGSFQPPGPPGEFLWL